MKRTQVTIFAVPLHKVTLSETLALVRQWIEEATTLHQICTVNPEFVMKAQKDPAFLEVLQSADLNVSDGIGLVWASRQLKNPLPERVAGSDLVYHIANECAQHGWRLFLLGAAEGVAAEAGRKLQSYYPNLIIAGSYAGSPRPEENDHIVTMINQSSADVLYVAYGAPAQDVWINRNRHNLTTVRVAIGVGGSLDFIAGKVRRAPLWVQKVWLEWAYRVIQQPSRWRRVLYLPRFMLSILWQRLTT